MSSVSGADSLPASVPSGDTSVASPATPTDAPASTGGTPLGATPADGVIPTTTDPGPIPYARFHEVNERMKAAERRWQETQQRFGDLSQVHPDRFKYGQSLVDQLEAAPVETVAQLLNALATRDEYKQGIASHAARILHGVRGSQPKEDPEPQPNLVADDGSPVYSAQQQRAWYDWNQRRMKAEFETQLAQRLQPFEAMAKERDAERKQHAVQQLHQHAESVAAQQYERAQTWHGFKANEREIAAVWDEHKDWSLQDAYLHVLHTKILPAMPAQAQAKVVADLQQKAAAQTIAPSNAARPSQPDFKGDFRKALEWASKNGR